MKMPHDDRRRHRLFRASSRSRRVDQHKRRPAEACRHLRSVQTLSRGARWANILPEGRGNGKPRAGIAHQAPETRQKQQRDRRDQGLAMVCGAQCVWPSAPEISALDRRGRPGAHRDLAHLLVICPHAKAQGRPPRSRVIRGRFTDSLCGPRASRQTCPSRSQHALGVWPWLP